MGNEPVSETENELRLLREEVLYLRDQVNQMILKKARQPQQWEYWTHEMYSINQSDLDNQGKLGWELVQVIHGLNSALCVYKRPAPE